MKKRAIENKSLKWIIFHTRVSADQVFRLMREYKATDNWMQKMECQLRDRDNMTHQVNQVLFQEITQHSPYITTKNLANSVHNAGLGRISISEINKRLKGVF